MAEVYIRLALKFEPFTFELLFFALPIDRLLTMYPLYHEMGFDHIEKEYRDAIRFSKLDAIMKALKVTTTALAKETEISIATLRSLRYGYRDTGKLEARTLIKIASCLKIKPQSLL